MSLDSTITVAFDKATAFVAKTAPVAYNAALDTIRLAGWIALGRAIAFAVLSFVLYRVCKWAIAKAAAVDDYSDAEIPFIVGAVISGIAGICVGIAAAVGLLSTETWLAIIDPRTAFIYKLIG